MYKATDHKKMTAMEAPPTRKRVIRSEKEKHVNPKATMKESKIRQNI
jgi:hypothetical protein